MDSASARATGSGRAMARFFGNSSPKTIWTTVANSSAATVPIARPGPGRDADAAEQLAQPGTDQGFGDVTDHEAGDGDAELGAGQHERGAVR